MVYKMVYNVDGGCRRNGHPDAIGAAAAVQMLRGGNWRSWTRELPDYPAPTSQRAEITAIIMALELALEKYEALGGCPRIKVTIKSDSRYAIDCMNKLIYKWCDNDWTNAVGNPVVNQDLIREASDLDDRVKDLGSVTYLWIPRKDNKIADEECKNCLKDQE